MRVCAAQSTVYSVSENELQLLWERRDVCGERREKNKCHRRKCKHCHEMVPYKSIDWIELRLPSQMYMFTE